MDDDDALAEQIVAEAGQDGLIGHLRQSNARLARQLAEAKVRTSELVEAVYRAATDAIVGLDVPPVPAPAPDHRSHGEEVAVAVLVGRPAS